MGSHRVEVGDIALQVTVSGPSTGPVLLLLHGWPASGRFWRPLLPLLDSDFRLIVPDQRGFGESDRPVGTAAYSMEHLVADAVGLIDWAGVERAGVVGHDFGGSVAWGLGISHPDRVIAMVIMASPHPMRMRAAALDNPDQLRRAFYVWLMHAGDAGERLLAAGEFRWLADWAFAPSVPAAERAAYRREWAAPGAFRAMAEWYRANYRPELFDPAVPLELPPVRVPVRYVHPERDPAFVAEMATGSGDFVDAAYDELVVPGTSHWLVGERPEAVAGLIRSWMAAN